MLLLLNRLECCLKHQLLQYYYLTYRVTAYYHCLIYHYYLSMRDALLLIDPVHSLTSYSYLYIFYTSVVLFFGFSVFMLSSFGGTIALGGLVAVTLFFGMLSNLMLLPALVLTLNKTLANKQELAEPRIDIIEPTDEAIDNLPKTKR